MYTKEKLNDIYARFAQAIDISEELFEKAVREYQAMSRWIDEETPDFEIHIYPQGSFVLGTVVKPLTDDDDYDIDLVCEFAEDYGLNAKQLKVDVVKPLLTRYKKTTTDVVEKSRCWRVDYEHFEEFHMDVIPAAKLSKHIKITDKDEACNTYEYIGSNPRGYTEWFKSRMAARRNQILLEKRFDSVRCQAEIDDITEFKIKTPLQSAIQILKRHRDMMFEHDDTNSAPISIIMTTVAAQVYDDEDNIFDTLSAFFSRARTYVDSNIRGGQYHIDNPSYTGVEKENFADKWNEHPERASTFFAWLDKAKADLIDHPLSIADRIGLSEHLNTTLGGKSTRRVFAQMAQEEREAIVGQTVKVVPSTGTLSREGTVNIPQHRHYGT